ncbi:hydrolase [Philodulcilactobacillus myokoensis]|uniref:Hydrolase n=1 Tax=Philodulcilactobacillus myokoensis TaxID=2929573 RepID=A0A9W6B1F4_9LACO|nr:HD domain-containing protein [Philodulcilactobacillus myokoensis]GLB46771.1 hydrolase [Philodulcilactobacillus myokoensis]
MKQNAWEKDQKYISIVADLLNTKEVQKLALFTHHHHSTRLKHCIAVSYMSYLIAKKMHLDYRAAARGGLLHDLFYYNWRTTKFNLGSHAFIHPRVALRNAERITVLTPKEKDIILKHMWGFTLACPKYPESVIVSLVDDYSAIYEFLRPVRQNFKSIFSKLN